MTRPFYKSIRRSTIGTTAIAAILGIIITCVDLFADNGEISPAVILFLFLIAGIFITALREQIGLLLLVAMFLPSTHLILFALGYPTTLQPNTVTSILMVGFVGLGATLIGGFITALLRRLVLTQTRSY